MKVRGIPLPLSQSCRDVNPQLADKSSTAGRALTRVGLRCVMNNVEAEYAMILEAQRRAGEILAYQFEGITLRFANVKYSPDFVVIESEYAWKFVEIKGGFITGNRERAIERYRHAKTFWPWFRFEMMQKTKDGWKQIL